MVLPGTGGSLMHLRIRISGGRYLLRFKAVDYLAEIWVNGIYAGGHEGSETPFDLDVTEL